MKVSQNGAEGCIFILGRIFIVIGVITLIASLFDDSLPLVSCIPTLGAGLIMYFCTKHIKL